MLLAYADAIPMGKVRDQSGGAPMIRTRCFKEHRIGQEPVPEDIKSRLEEAQLATLSRLQGFGWTIKFVRRPLFQQQIVVLVDPSVEKHAILHEDGAVEQNPDITIR